MSEWKPKCYNSKPLTGGALPPKLQERFLELWRHTCALNGWKPQPPISEEK